MNWFHATRAAYCPSHGRVLSWIAGAACLYSVASGTLRVTADGSRWLNVRIPGCGRLRRAAVAIIAIGFLLLGLWAGYRLLEATVSSPIWLIVGVALSIYLVVVVVQMTRAVIATTRAGWAPRPATRCVRIGTPSP